MPAARGRSLNRKGYGYRGGPVAKPHWKKKNKNKNKKKKKIGKGKKKWAGRQKTVKQLKRSGKTKVLYAFV